MITRVVPWRLIRSHSLFFFVAILNQDTRYMGTQRVTLRFLLYVSRRLACRCLVWSIYQYRSCMIPAVVIKKKSAGWPLGVCFGRYTSTGPVQVPAVVLIHNSNGSGKLMTVTISVTLIVTVTVTATYLPAPDTHFSLYAFVPFARSHRVRRRAPSLGNAYTEDQDGARLIMSG